MKQFLISFAFLCYGAPFAQAQHTADDEAISAGWYQLGINTQIVLDSFLDQTITTPLELLIKRQGDNGAWRARLMGSWSASNLGYSENEDERVDDGSNVGLALGYEWQRSIKNKWSWYYGIEIEGQRGRGNYSDLSVFGDTEDNRIEWKTVQKQKNDLLSLIPLAGIKFQITPKLSISTEFRLAASTKKVKYHTEYLYKERGLTTSTSETTNYRSQSVDFRPYSGIYLAIVL